MKNYEATKRSGKVILPFYPRLEKIGKMTVLHLRQLERCPLDYKVGSHPNQLQPTSEEHNTIHTPRRHGGKAFTLTIVYHELQSTKEKSKIVSTSSHTAKYDFLT